MNTAGLAMIEAESLDQVKGHCIYSMVSGEYREAFEAMTRDVFKGESRTLEFKMVGLKGRPLWLFTHTVPLRNDKGEIVSSLSITTDITERKLAEEALRENQARLDLALQSAHMGVWRWEIIENRRYFDDLTCQLLGIDHASFTGTAEEFFSVVHPEDRAMVREALSRTLEHDAPYEPEYRVVWPDGTVRSVTARGRLVRDERGRPVRINGILWDITEKRLLAEERLKTEKLESIGTLAGGIAHDFNNLLQGVFGYISMAKLTVGQRERSLAMLEQAEQALHRSVSLTSQLLTFSKGGKPVKKVLALLPVIENACRFALSGSRSDCRIAAEDGLWSVEADEGQIAQVIQNIVLNADQAMPLGGTIEVSARNVPAYDAMERQGIDQAGRVEISIRDSGVGIPAEYLPKIFDPYFTTKEKGSGLGLATSYSIIRNHGGSLMAASVQGKGSAFTILLPASLRAPEEPPPAAVPGPVRRGRVLIMDDEDVVRQVAGELIRSLGHEVELAEHGERAIERYRDAQAAGRSFDVVILDLTIRGGMGGLETLRKLRELDPGVKAVVSSGYSDDEVTSNYEMHGFRSYLRKPYTAAGLNDMLNELMA